MLKNYTKIEIFRERYMYIVVPQGLFFLAYRDNFIGELDVAYYVT